MKPNDLAVYQGSGSSKENGIVRLTFLVVCTEVMSGVGVVKSDEEETQIDVLFAPQEVKVNLKVTGNLYTWNEAAGNADEVVAIHEVELNHAEAEVPCEEDYGFDLMVVLTCNCLCHSEVEKAQAEVAYHPPFAVHQTLLSLGASYLLAVSVTSLAPFFQLPISPFVPAS